MNVAESVYHCNTMEETGAGGRKGEEGGQVEEKPLCLQNLIMENNKNKSTKNTFKQMK